MLPNKVMQLDYNKFNSFVLRDLYQIQKHNFTYVVGKIRNGVFPASIIANKCNKELFFLSIPKNNKNIEFQDIDSLSHVENKERNNDSNIGEPQLLIPNYLFNDIKAEETTLLLVDSICGTGETLLTGKKYLESLGYNVITYATLVDLNTKYKPDIYGLLDDKFFQPPWESRSFTPQSHLERLAESKSNILDAYSCIGFSSRLCQLNFFDTYNLKVDIPYMKVFSESDGNQSDFTYKEANTVYKNFMEEKANYIKNNGITHFIESDWVQSIILSEKCPITEIIYFSGEDLHRQIGVRVDIKEIINLKFE